MSLLEEYHQISSEAKTFIKNFKKVPINLSSINKTGRFFLCDKKIIQPTALNDLLNIFSIKNELLREIHDDANQWVPLQKSLTNIKNDRVVTGIVKQVGENETLVRFLKEKINEESELNYEHGFNLLENFLNNHSENIELKNLYFSEENLALNASFKNTNSSIDVFQDQKDFWQNGFSFLYGLHKTVVSPFLFRQICSNGLISIHQFSQRYFSNKGLRQKSFDRLVTKTLSEDSRDMIIDSCGKMKSSNASLREYFQARNACLSVSKDLADTYFNDEQIQEAYKPYQIRYKNNKWLSSANSNVNSYEFFNRLTHCATHQTSLPQYISMQLNHFASEIFFKGPDLSFRAPDPFN